MEHKRNALTQIGHLDSFFQLFHINLDFYSALSIIGKKYIHI
jgi:hypothetical protein